MAQLSEMKRIFAHEIKEGQEFTTNKMYPNKEIAKIISFQNGRNIVVINNIPYAAYSSLKLTTTGETKPTVK